ncbi:MAG: hypothetical protein ACD_5C00261G0002 [uncultured bacterium]|nr:MAG: hypothetical protein ACD_5C00261G0002 [uncultured bacterium]
MKSFHYPLCIDTWSEEEPLAIQKVIQRGRYTMGDYVKEFEIAFSNYFGSRYAVMVNSGSSANLLAIAALCYKAENPLKPGDEVIVPSLSWATTYYPVHQYGLKLVFVDIDRETFNLDPGNLELAFSPKTKAVFLPHILGNPANIPAIQLFCKKHHLYFIEDNCESMGSKIENKYVGTFGICGTFSLFFSHHISTMEGGVIVTDDEEIYHLLLSLRSHGWTRHLPENNKLCKKNKNGFYENFRFILPGYNVRPLEISGAVGIEQLKKLDSFLEARRANAVFFRNKIVNCGYLQLQKETFEGSSSWFGFGLLVKNKELDREKLLDFLLEKKIDCRPIVSGNFLRSEVLPYLQYRVVGEHVNSDSLHDLGFFIGNHHIQMQAEIEQLGDLISNYFRTKTPCAA